MVEMVEMVEMDGGKGRKAQKKPAPSLRWNDLGWVRKCYKKRVAHRFGLQYQQWGMETTLIVKRLGTAYDIGTVLFILVRYKVGTQKGGCWCTVSSCWK